MENLDSSMGITWQPPNEPDNERAGIPINLLAVFKGNTGNPLEALIWLVFKVRYYGICNKERQQAGVGLYICHIVTHIDVCSRYGSRVHGRCGQTATAGLDVCVHL